MTVMPSTPICRGCAGNGIGQHVPPRTMQIIGGTLPIWILRSTGKLERKLEVSFTLSRARGVVKGPYAVILKAYRELADQGFEIATSHKLPPDPAWACEWCSGTGQPALSIGSMELSLKGIAVNRYADDDVVAQRKVRPDTLNAP